MFTPEEEKRNAMLAGKHDAALPNEKTLMTLITMMGAAKDGTTAQEKAIAGFAKGQMKYFLQAMEILSSAPTRKPTHAAAIAQRAAFQRQFGVDSFEGAMELAELLKAKADERELDLRLRPFVDDMVRMARTGDAAGAIDGATTGFSLTAATGGKGSEDVGSTAFA